MILRIIAAFVTSAGFGYIFKAPKRDIYLYGLVGAIGFWVLELSHNAFLATVVIAMLSLYFAKKRKNIATVYLVTGIIPYVPGAGIYNTMYYLVFGMREESLEAGLSTLMTVGSIALGFVFVFSINKALKETLLRLN